MPDVHAGAGCVIGFTGNLGDKVIPNIVGVDIGCGMRVLNLGNVVEIDFHAFNEHIRGTYPPVRLCVRIDSGSVRSWVRRWRYTVRQSGLSRNSTATGS